MTTTSGTAPKTKATTEGSWWGGPKETEKPSETGIAVTTTSDGSTKAATSTTSKFTSTVFTTTPSTTASTTTTTMMTTTETSTTMAPTTSSTTVKTTTEDSSKTTAGSQTPTPKGIITTTPSKRRPTPPIAALTTPKKSWWNKPKTTGSTRAPKTTIRPTPKGPSWTRPTTPKKPSWTRPTTPKKPSWMISTSAPPPTPPKKPFWAKVVTTTKKPPSWAKALTTKPKKPFWAKVPTTTQKKPFWAKAMTTTPKKPSWAGALTTKPPGMWPYKRKPTPAPFVLPTTTKKAGIPRELLMLLLMKTTQRPTTTKRLTPEMMLGITPSTTTTTTTAPITTTQPAVLSWTRPPTPPKTNLLRRKTTPKTNLMNKGKATAKPKSVYIPTPYKLRRPLFPPVANLPSPHTPVRRPRLPRLNTGFVPKECRIPPHSGYCGASVNAWYFDASRDVKQCRYMRYHICKGNANRFQTREACENFCIDLQRDPCKGAICPAYAPCVAMREENCVREALRMSRRVDEYCPPKHAVCRYKPWPRTVFQPEYKSTSRPTECFEPADAGSCYGRQRPQMKYYYVDKLKDCKRFYFSGCGGNNNRFDTKNQCMDYCG